MLNDRPLWVTIPTIGHSPHLIPLVNELEKDKAIDKIILTVNLEEYVEPIRDFFRFGGPTIEVLESWQQGKSIYHGWNKVIESARQMNAFMAVLNDDIILSEPHAISDIAQLLADHPRFAVIGLNWQDAPDQPKASSQLRRVHGSYRHHGVGGFAWVCDPHKVQTIPQDIVHWGGDDFIFFRAEDDGYKVGIANHVHVEHPSPATTSVTQSWTNAARGQDRIIFERYYPKRGW